MVRMLIKWYIGRALNTNLQRRKQRLVEEKVKHNKWMVEQFGMGRVILSKLFGSYFLYAFPNQNNSTEVKVELKDEFKPEYTKFYSKLEVAQRYEKMQKKKWNDVRIVPSYDANNNLVGYFLYAAGKIQLQPG